MFRKVTKKIEACVLCLVMVITLIAPFVNVSAEGNEANENVVQEGEAIRPGSNIYNCFNNWYCIVFGM